MPPRPRSRAGDLACALATAAIVGALAVPAARGLRAGADERAAIDTLVRLVDVQRRLAASGALDADGDGRGEHGPLALLRGFDGPRFDVRPDGVGTRDGYRFQVWLAARGGGALAAPSDALDVDAAERRWCAYAWPDEPGGGRTFFVDESGAVLEARRADVVPYAGERGPGADAAFRVPNDLTSPNALRAEGADGCVWTLVRRAPQR